MVSFFDLLATYHRVIINFINAVITYTKKYDKSRFKILRDNYEKIRDIYYDEHHHLEREHDGKRIYYKVSDFPEIQKMIDTIPGVKKNSAFIYVMDFPMTISPKKEKNNRWVRYELVLRGGRGCIFDTWRQRRIINDGSDIIFDPASRHKYIKRSVYTRLSLVVDVDRFKL